MYKSVYFCCFGLVVILVPISFCSEPNYPIWMVDLLDKPPRSTTSNLSVISQKHYIIDVFNINSDVSFFVIQAHSYIENITLSFDDPLQPNTHVTGTTVGLVWSNNMGYKNLTTNTVRFYLVRQNPISEKLQVLLAISTHAKGDPIPGGCNVNSNGAFETMIAPYQKITYDDDVITVKSKPPSKDDLFCTEANITTQMYYMYLKAHNNDIEEYFLGIQNMMTVERILQYGKKVPSGLGHNKFEQLYNLYRGTGRVFGIVSTLNGQKSAYIPSVSFGCNLNNWREECIGPHGVHWKLICAFLFILGAFLCFGGHRFFKTGLFIVGFWFGSIVTLVLVSIDDYFSTEVKAVYSVSTGVVFGCLWVLIWLHYGAPLISIQLTFLLCGILVASAMLFTEFGGLISLTNDVYYWLVFSIFVIITLMPIFLYPSLYHIVALSLLGSFAFITALSYYIGGNLPYILINSYRRIAVKDFGSAVVDPPYEFIDITQTLLWILLFGLGIYIQYKHSVGKAPFPPHRVGVIVIRPLVNDRTPLIESANAAASYDERKRRPAARAVPRDPSEREPRRGFRFSFSFKQCFTADIQN